MRIEGLRADNLTTIATKPDEDGYKKLAVAIVERAIDDLQEDLQILGPGERVWKKYAPFFLSDWFKLLMDADGETLLKQLIENYRKGKSVYKWKGSYFYGKRNQGNLY